jgi:hypothetical protein
LHGQVPSALSLSSLLSHRLITFFSISVSSFPFFCFHVYALSAAGVVFSKTGRHNQYEMIVYVNRSLLPVTYGAAATTKGTAD